MLLLESRKIFLVILAGLILTSCHGWQSRNWHRKELPEIEMVGLGYIKVFGLTHRFIESSSLRDSIRFVLRRKGIESPEVAYPFTNPECRENSSDSDDFLKGKELLALNSSYPGRYWLRGEIDIRPEDTLVQRTYSISLFFQVIDLSTGRMLAQASLQKTDLDSVSRSEILDGLDRLISQLLGTL